MSYGMSGDNQSYSGAYNLQFYDYSELVVWVLKILCTANITIIPIKCGFIYIDWQTLADARPPYLFGLNTLLCHWAPRWKLVITINPIWHERGFFADINNDNGTSDRLSFLSTVRSLCVAAVGLLLVTTCAAFIPPIFFFLFLLTFQQSHTPKVLNTQAWNEGHL